MSLYGALFSGVSGLTAQSSAMGAISDNITNVSTVGYKSTQVQFQTLVTKQTSGSFYSAGGVQAKPRQGTDVQGLLQASTSQTDLAISGNGFFVVNTASTPGISDPYLFTRAGSFIQDEQGFLKNSQGYYLQGWPTNGDGKVVPSNSDVSVSNQNIISSDYVESINLNRVGGTAQPTSNVSIGANLPSGHEPYDSSLSDPTLQSGYQKTDVEFYDSLGSSNNMSVEYLRSSYTNQWDVRIDPPSGVQVVTILDQANASNTSDVYSSAGHLEFTGTRPVDGSYVEVNGNTYEFDLDGDGVGANSAQVDTMTPGALVANTTYWLTIGGESVSFTTDAVPTPAEMTLGFKSAIALNTNMTATVTVVDGATLALTSKVPGATYTVTYSDAVMANVNTPATGRIQVDTSGNANLSADLDTFIAKVQAADPTFSATAADSTFGFTSSSHHKIAKERGNSNNIVITGGPGTGAVGGVANLGDININITGLVSGTDPLTLQGRASSKSFDIQATNTYGTTAQIDKITPANVGNTDVFTLSLHGQTVTYTGDASATLAEVTAGLTTAINNNAILNKLVKASDQTTYLNITSNYAGLGFTTTSGTTDGDGTATQTLTVATSTANSNGALAFTSGIPTGFNAAAVEMLGFSDGAEDMNDVASAGDRITLDFGSLNEANGMTQFGDEFVQNSTGQNGSKFGTFSGVTIGDDGLVTALFDNGETRKIFQIPMATFVNPNQLESKTGNAWSATQFSGDYTLREPDSGPSGQVVQSSLEASTVDIGAEFTNMIVVQRAYSASTKIISTADQMLEELMCVKR